MFDQPFDEWLFFWMKFCPVCFEQFIRFSPIFLLFRTLNNGLGVY